MALNLYQIYGQTILGHIAAYASPDAFNSTAVLSYRTDPLVHQLHPGQSIAYNQTFGADGIIHACNLYGPALDNLDIAVNGLSIDTQNGTAAAFLTITYDFKAIGDEPAEKGYATENVWIHQFDSTGEKIYRLDEFIDVQRVLGYAQDKATRYANYYGLSN